MPHADGAAADLGAARLQDARGGQGRRDVETPPARILVVDDDRLMRTKLRLALRTLGHVAREAEDGVTALELLAGGGFDAVLLDIVMPGMDGYDVLRAIKADETLRDVPVIVISGLDEEIDNVVRAIDLGAEDFLPKAFDIAILRARLETSLRKKRFRDAEREQSHVMARLIEAAAALESDSFHPDRLSLDDVTERQDALGGFARVFKGMVLEIYAREARLRRRLRTLVGVMLVLAVGVCFGVTAPLARIAAQQGATPLGLAVWGSLLGGVIALGGAAAFGRLRAPSWSDVQFYLLWAVVTGVSQKLILFWVSANVPASTVSLVLTLKGFLVFVAAGALAIERVNARRLGGLAIGLVGLALVIQSRGGVVADDALFWLAATAILPVLTAVEGILLATRMRRGVDPLAAVGFMQVASFAVLLPLAWDQDALTPLGPVIGPFELTVAAMAVAGVAATVLSVRLTQATGPVFASQTAYSCALAGIVWSMLLLGETLAPVAWLALGLMLVGLYFVGPKESADDRMFRLPIAPERRAARALE